MGNAFYQTTGKMKGSVKDLQELTEVLRGYTQGTTDVFFTNLEFTNDVKGEISFTADGPYGKFDNLNDVDVFREMAKSAPMSWFEAAIEGEDDWTQSELHCCLKDGVLKTESGTYTLKGQGSKDYGSVEGYWYEYYYGENLWHYRVFFEDDSSEVKKPYIYVIEMSLDREADAATVRSSVDDFMATVKPVQ